MAMRKILLIYRISFLAGVLSLASLIFLVEGQPTVNVILFSIGILLLIPVGIFIFYSVDKTPPWNFHRTLMADREVVLAAVKQSGWALEHASDELKADRDLVLAAVEQDGKALEYASDELKADREVVLAARKQN